MKKSFLYIAASLLLLTGCNLDINENPNYPSSSDVTADLIFPSVENAIADVVGDQMFNYAGFFAQYFEQKPSANQYNDLAELNINESSNLFDRCYRLLYAGALQDVKEIMSRDISEGDAFICTVMRAYAYQLLVDNLDQCPYTEALQGSSNNMPAWDAGKDVYVGVLAEMDAAEAALTDGTKTITLTDPMLNKDIDAWIVFANQLRLRMYMRLYDSGDNSYQDKAIAVAKKLAASGFDDVAWDVYSNAEGQYNPWYDTYFNLTNNHVGASPLIDYMNSMNDPRVGYAFYTTANDESVYEGQVPGSKTLLPTWLGVTSSQVSNYVSHVNYEVMKSAPIYLMTASETYFLLAEVAQRFGASVGITASDAYEEGVAADPKWSSTSDIMAFLGGTGAWSNASDKLDLIYRQKWVALFMVDHMEGWTEARRTDVPELTSLTGKQVFDNEDGYTPGDFIIPVVNYSGGKLAKRVPYPADARSLNSNTPATKLISDPVFWDK